MNIKPLFASIDARDAHAFGEFLTEDCSFRFGNADPVQGRQAVIDGVAGFFAALAGLQHQVDACWSVDDHVISHGQVTYTRQDGSTLSVPFANIFRMEGALIADYRIFCDNSALFA